MTHLTVAVRVRPLSDREVSAKSVSIVSVENGKTISVTNIKVPEQNAGDSRERVRRFTFDYCFNTESTQDDVFQNIGKEIAKAIRKRFHSCVLAYGQSSTGKTHTMIGQENNPGLVPKLCQNIFDYLAETAVGSETEGLNATVSYLEIYNEKVRDLLDNSEVISGNKVSLKVREHPKKGPYVQGLIEKSVTDALGLLNCLETGNLNRRTAATNANPRSSRSHCVFTVTCSGGVKLKLVDLAGSERAGSRCHTTPRFREGANINRSLVALRNVISALADQSRPSKTFRKRFIPYRDSTLTWLLKDTLGGNSKTTMISTISPSSTCYNETVNTLRFGQRAKQIVVQPIVNEDPKERTIRELRAEIAKLKELLASTEIPRRIDTNENLAVISKYLSSWELATTNIATETEGFTSWENLNQFTDSGLTSSSISFDENQESVSVKSEVTILNSSNNFVGASNFESLLYPACGLQDKTFFSKSIDGIAKNFTALVYPATVFPDKCIDSNASNSTNLKAEALDNTARYCASNNGINEELSEVLNITYEDISNNDLIHENERITDDVTDILNELTSHCGVDNSILKCKKPNCLGECPKSVHFSEFCKKTCLYDSEKQDCIFTEFTDRRIEDLNTTDSLVENRDVSYIDTQNKTDKSIKLKKYKEKIPNTIKGRTIKLKLFEDTDYKLPYSKGISNLSKEDEYLNSKVSPGQQLETICEDSSFDQNCILNEFEVYKVDDTHKLDAVLSREHNNYPNLNKIDQNCILQEVVFPYSKHISVDDSSQEEGINDQNLNQFSQNWSLQELNINSCIDSQEVDGSQQDYKFVAQKQFGDKYLSDYQPLGNTLNINQLFAQLQTYAEKKKSDNFCGLITESGKKDVNIINTVDFKGRKDLNKLLEIGSLNTNVIVTRLETVEECPFKSVLTELCKKPETRFEELIPVMDVTSKIANPKAKSPLRRTYSVDQKINTKNPQFFGSHEALQSPSTSKIAKKPVLPTLRKRSMDTSTTSLRSEKSTLSTKSTLTRKIETPVVTKSEKGVVTDVKGSPKIEIKSKVDSHRKSLIKPRSQIVAAVTQRLYNKIKKKDIATDTAEDITLPDVPKELSICSNARLRLQELTQKALKAHRRRNEETQTDLFPVMRVKEISTDVYDLQLELGEVKHMDTSTEGIEFKHIATNTVLDCFLGDDEETCAKALVLTRTCGTQSDDNVLDVKTMTETYLDKHEVLAARMQEVCKMKESNLPHSIIDAALAARIHEVCNMQEANRNHGASTSEMHKTLEDKPMPISFTKYLNESKYETINPFSAVHPIYTSSVNINVNHNYMNRNQTNNDSISDDSLEEQPRPDVCFPTPDLISNHNSLEQHNTHDPNNIDRLRKEMRYATNSIIEEEFETNDDFNITNQVICMANCSRIDDCNESVDAIDVHPTYAPQTCLQDNFSDDHHIFTTEKLVTHQAKSRIEAPHLQAVKINQPVLLKTSKCPPITDDSDCETTCFGDVKNSLEYYNEKKVSFSHTKQDRVFEAMTNFLQEVVSTMTNLTKVASKLDNSIPNNFVDPSEIVKAATTNDSANTSNCCQHQQHDLACSLRETLNTNFNLTPECVEQSFDVQVIVNDIHGLPKCRGKSKRREKRPKPSPPCSTYCSETTQTSPIRKDASTIMDDSHIDDHHIANKYDDVVIDSCDRLEKMLAKLLKNEGKAESNQQHNDTQLAFDNLHKFPQPFSVNTEWHPNSIQHPLHISHRSTHNINSSNKPVKNQNYNHYLPQTSADTCFQNSHFHEDSSLESNPTFSDYGSLPRRKYSRTREPSCSPSGYLRQLTTMRKQIVKSSRDEMVNETQLNM